jgi:Tol biopolymer transport system component
MDPVSSNSRRDIVLATLDDPTPQTLIAAEAFTATLPDSRSAERTLLRYVLPHPTSPELLLVIGFDTQTQQGYVWSYQRQTSEVQLLLSLRASFGFSVSVLPNGRWLVMQGVETQNNSDRQALLLYNLETGETRRHILAWTLLAPAFVYDWTADSQWLVYVVNGQIGLTAVDHNYTQVISSPTAGCAALAWANK